MKATLFALAAAGVVNAQFDPTDLPQCAQGCLTSALPTECLSEVSNGGGIDAVLECACPQIDSILEDDCFASNCEDAELEEGANAVRDACATLGAGPSSSSAGDESMTTTVASTTVTSPMPTPTEDDDVSTTVTETETTSPSPTDEDGEDDGDDNNDDEDGNNDDEDNNDDNNDEEDGEGGEGGDDDSAAVKPFAGLAAAVFGLMAAL